MSLYDDKNELFAFLTPTLLIFAHFCLIFGQFFTLGFSNCYWSVKLSYRYISYNHLYQFVVIRSVKKPSISHIAAFSPEKRWILSSVGPVDLFWPALFEFCKKFNFLILLCYLCINEHKKILLSWIWNFHLLRPTPIVI